MHFKIVVITLLCCAAAASVNGQQPRRDQQEVVDHNVSGEGNNGEQPAPRIPQWLKPNVPVNQPSFSDGNDVGQYLQQQLTDDDAGRGQQQSNEDDRTMQWSNPEWNQQGLQQQQQQQLDNNPWNDAQIEQQQFAEQLNGSNGVALETQLAIEMMSVSRLRNIIQRGRDMMTQLPSMGVVVFGRLLNKVPTPNEIFHYSKKTLMGLPSEIISYVVDSVCKFVCLGKI